MIASTIRDMLEQEPFQPFLIRASSGRAYPVRDPELVVLMKSSVFIATPNSDHAATLPYLHITAVETPINGHTRRLPRGKRRG